MSRALRHFVVLLAMVTATAHAAEVLIAVASNFAAPMQKIVAAFESGSGHRAKLAVGATGAFATQVRNGAPFDVLLAADEATPQRLEQDGFAVPGSRFTYALGRLVLWSAKAGVVDAQGEVLKRGSFDRIAIANPKLAPYGQAAVETMQRLGVYERLQRKFVQGENISQAHQFVASGNAALGFVALSQVTPGHGSSWVVPAHLHAPLKQDAVLLAHGKGNEAATALLTFLKGGEARGIMRAYGYGP